MSNCPQLLFQLMDGPDFMEATEKVNSHYSKKAVGMYRNLWLLYI